MEHLNPINRENSTSFSLHNSIWECLVTAYTLIYQDKVFLCKDNFSKVLETEEVKSFFEKEAPFQLQ